MSMLKSRLFGFKVCCRDDDIECMKKLALMIMFGICGVVLSGEEFTIQTISAQKASSITPAFEKKVQKSALPITKKKEGDCNIVTVGKYPTAKAAASDMKKAKAISKDAFVRTMERPTPKACESKSEHIAVKETNATVIKKEEVAAVKESAAPMHKEEKAVVVVPQASHVEPTAPVVVKTVENVAPVAEPCKIQPCEKVANNVYLYDRNLGRKSDIGEAIEYYKNSPYHTFRPIALQMGK